MGLDMYLKNSGIHLYSLLLKIYSDDEEYLYSLLFRISDDKLNHDKEWGTPSSVRWHLC